MKVCTHDFHMRDEEPQRPRHIVVRMADITVRAYLNGIESRLQGSLCGLDVAT